MAAALAATRQQVFVEIESARPELLVGEACEVVLRLGVTPEALAGSLLQPFRRELDLPLRVELPWWEGGPALRRFGGAEEVQPESPRRRSLALNGEVATAEWIGRVQRGGQDYEVFEARRTFVAEAAGEWSLDAPELRYWIAEEFDEDLFGARVPRRTIEEVRRGAPLALRVAAWPAEGRPADFDGAVGRFTIEVESEAREIEVGAWLRVAMRIRAEGRAAVLPRPRLHELPGWRLAGVSERAVGGGLMLEADFECLDAAAQEFPALSLSFLDPGPPARYVTARSLALPIQVRAPETAEVERARRDGAGAGAVGKAGGAAGAEVSEREPSGRWAWWLLPAVFLLGMGAARRLQARRAAAVQVLAPALQAADAPPAKLLAHALARRLGCSEPAVIGPDLEARLRAAGVAEDLAARAARLMEELVAARYGGPVREDAAGEAQALSRILAQTAAGGRSRSADGPRP